MALGVQVLVEPGDPCAAELERLLYAPLTQAHEGQAVHGEHREEMALVLGKLRRVQDVERSLQVRLRLGLVGRLEEPGVQHRQQVAEAHEAPDVVDQGKGPNEDRARGLGAAERDVAEVQHANGRDVELAILGLEPVEGGRDLVGVGQRGLVQARVVVALHRLDLPPHGALGRSAAPPGLDETRKLSLAGRRVVRQPMLELGRQARHRRGRRSGRPRPRQRRAHLGRDRRAVELAGDVVAPPRADDHQQVQPQPCAAAANELCEEPADQVVGLVIAPQAIDHGPGADSSCHSPSRSMSPCRLR